MKQSPKQEENKMSKKESLRILKLLCNFLTTIDEQQNENRN